MTNLLGLAAMSYLLLTIHTAKEPPLNQETFTPFTVTAREQVSPTAFILTVQPSSCVPARPGSIGSYLPLPGRYLREFGAASFFAEVWDRGATWSVEVKQPLLQVAREYTPLPAVPGSGAQGGRLATPPELRFLVRRLEGGEVSGYLAGLGVGDTVELRGPHYGFEVGRRLGGRERVVFLAGGTGIAPALQVVGAVLEGAGKEGGERGPSVDIVWANRQRADCRGCPGLADGKGEVEAGMGGPVLELLAEVQRRYPGRVSVRCTVDEDRSFVEMGALVGLVGSEVGGRGGGEVVKGCWLHDQDAVAWRPAADVGVDAEMKKSGQCRCGSGKNLLFVSGPDGFVKHFAGPKRWANAMELQGPVGGILGMMRARYPDVMKDWLVLKL